MTTSETIVALVKELTDTIELKDKEIEELETAIDILESDKDDLENEVRELEDEIENFEPPNSIKAQNRVEEIFLDEIKECLKDYRNGLNLPKIKKQSYVL